MTTITVTETIHIERSPEVVWDFTQDYTKRTLWDKSILEATTMQTAPRVIAIRGAGIKTQLLYKQDERPHQTSLAMINSVSPIIAGGGGSWQYRAMSNGTEWRQTNTLILKNTIAATLFRPMLSFLLKRNTRKAMKKAKAMLELSK